MRGGGGGGGRGEGQSWQPSMVRFGEVGTPELFQVLTEWVSRNIFVRGGRLSRATLGSIRG
jgi:hypothetical protein